MNSFFCSIGKDIEAAPNSPLNGHVDINNKSHIFRFRTINIEEIIEVVSNVKASKGFGIDHLSSYFIEQAIPYIENSLAFIFNTSIENSVFQFSKMVTRPINPTIVLFRLCQCFQEYLRSLFINSFTNTLKKIPSFLSTSLDLEPYILLQFVY